MLRLSAQSIIEHFVKDQVFRAMDVHFADLGAKVHLNPPLKRGLAQLVVLTKEEHFRFVPTSSMNCIDRQITSSFLEIIQDDVGRKEYVKFLQFS